MSARSKSEYDLLITQKLILQPTADYAHEDGDTVDERSFVSGVRFWF